MSPLEISQFWYSISDRELLISFSSTRIFCTLIFLVGETLHFQAGKTFESFRQAYGCECTQLILVNHPFFGPEKA